MYVLVAAAAVAGLLGYKYFTKKSQYEECLSALLDKGVRPKDAVLACSEGTDRLTVDDFLKAMGLAMIGYMLIRQSSFGGWSKAKEIGKRKIEELKEADVVKRLKSAAEAAAKELKKE